VGSLSLRIIAVYQKILKENDVLSTQIIYFGMKMLGENGGGRIVY